MDTNHRMREIAASLGRDMKDLLHESAAVVAGLFKNGLCTVRGAANRWKTFARSVGDAAGVLLHPFQGELRTEPLQQPLVTVAESTDERLPAGTRMTLYEAEEITKKMYEAAWDSGQPERSVKLAIDYTLDGETDRYWLRVCTEPGHGTMLEQMQDYVTAKLRNSQSIADQFASAPAPLARLLHEKFGPQLHDDLTKLSTRVHGHFRQHCTISELEQRFQQQAEAMPEKQRARFLDTVNAEISDLRDAANRGQEPERSLKRIAPETPRQSVRVKLQAIQKSQSDRPRAKVRSAPFRDAR